MTIFPLPQFEADLKKQREADDRAYAELTAPKTIVVRYGVMGMIGEFPYSGTAKPGCGSKIVINSYRGTEIGEMLTSTCPNAGCGKSVTRKQMLDYIHASGGKQYPFSTRGKALRVATHEDTTAQTRIEQSRHELKMIGRRACEELKIDTKIVDAEPLLGGELLTYYYGSEDRMDINDHERLVKKLTSTLEGKHGSRVDLRQVGARDEARITADYERCGEYCCCKNFLKVLKPVQMRSAKVQKATLDPLKISGRCGRLMCCLRYEDQTYTELRKRLPNRKKPVGTPDGDGIVVNTQILTQLVLVELDATRERIAVPIEDITEPGMNPVANAKAEAAAQAAAQMSKPAFARERTEKPKREPKRTRTDKADKADTPTSRAPDKRDRSARPDETSGTSQPARRASRKRGRRPQQETLQQNTDAARQSPQDGAPRSADSSPATPSQGKRRRRRSRAADELKRGSESSSQNGSPQSKPPSSDAPASPQSNDTTNSTQPSSSSKSRRRRRGSRGRGGSDRAGGSDTQNTNDSPSSNDD